ncbi:MAG TPA: hypothetical protein VKZ53_04060 [Candidatus Angelobacter sp.]|nr:hypothetical protein [Candidatus Angelobacter sp.]
MKNSVGTYLKAVLGCCCLLWSIAGHCQGKTATAQLTITMTVQSSIGLVFNNDALVGTSGFCPLTNPGTNNVGLDLGTASFTGGENTPCVLYSHLSATVYQVQSGFDVVVTKANSSSPNYRLAAEISTAPLANVIWLIAPGVGAGVALTNTGFTQLDASDTYGSSIQKNLQVQVKNTVAATTLQETITFLATAN